MRAYSADQWVLFFFFYCFCGWLWESCYVSAMQRRWVNRGFLHGPLLPIYGTGAILILLATIRVQNQPALVFLFGMAAATALEYFTGAAMEGLFKVRYWDYSQKKYNVHGYICLSSSLAWGAFSILMVRVIHPPVAGLILGIPATFSAVLAVMLSALGGVDAVQSFRAALDLRRLLEKLTEENEDLRRLAMRAEVILAFAGDDLQKFRDRTQVERILLQDRLAAEKARRGEAWAERKLRREEALEEALSRRASAKLRALDNIAQALEQSREKLADSLVGQELADRRNDLDEALQRLRERQTAVRARTAKNFQKSLRILRGNPSARAERYAKAMEDLKRLNGRRKAGR